VKALFSKLLLSGKRLWNTADICCNVIEKFFTDLQDIIEITTGILELSIMNGTFCIRISDGSTGSRT
jgi:hypothetical protein